MLVSPEKTAIILPTFNAAPYLREWMHSYDSQTFKPKWLYVIDSSSTDETQALVRAMNINTVVIPASDFNHGGTRQMGCDLVPNAEVVVFLTQDAILADCDALARLIKCFDDPKTGAAYGRQLPHLSATPIEAHARLFNYPERSRTKNYTDRTELGFKTIFISNAFGAYRRHVLVEVGGFPTNIIFGEDSCTAAKILQRGWKIAYCAEAKVTHSHHYGFLAEFKRYFDIGVFHARETWIRQEFGNAEGNGQTYVISELRYLREHNPLLIPSAILRTAIKYFGYRLGLAERYIPIPVKYHLGMNKRFWITKHSKSLPQNFRKEL